MQGRAEFIPTLVSDKRSYLEEGLSGRTFNAFPQLVSKQQVSAFAVLFAGIYSIENSITQEAIQHWFKEITVEACRQILDGYGQIKWELIELLEWESLEYCYLNSHIQKLLHSYVHTVLQQASQQLKTVIDSKPAGFYSAFTHYVTQFADRWIEEVLVQTQQKEMRDRHAIIQALVKDYHLTIERSEKTSSNLTKLLSPRKNARTIEKQILTTLALRANDETLSLYDLFLQARLDCQAQEVGQEILARVLTYYIHQAGVTEGLEKQTTTHVIQQLLKTAPVPEKTLPAANQTLEMSEEEIALANEKAEAEVKKTARWMAFFIPYPAERGGSVKESQTVKQVSHFACGVN